jgi:hypothetical protein
VQVAYAGLDPDVFRSDPEKVERDSRVEVLDGDSSPSGRLALPVDFGEFVAGLLADCRVRRRGGRGLVIPGDEYLRGALRTRDDAACLRASHPE